MSIVKYSISNVSNTIRANNVAVGINNVGYGPTDTTGFYSGINVPSGGYVVYRFPNGAGAPNIYVAQNDTELINLAGRSNATPAAQAISHINGLSNTIIIDRNYENIVTDSLVLCLDAGTLMSYLRSGTTWRDISGNGRDGTLTNGPTFDSGNGGSIFFDGTDDFVQCSGSLTVTAATFVAWIKRNGNQGQYDGILFSRGASVTGINFQTSNQLGYHWNNTVNTYTWGSGLTIPNSAWCMVAVSVTSTAATAYLCQSGGITTATRTVNHASSGLNDIKLAQDDAGSRFFNGNIAIAQIYNRALSTIEITQNFDATKARYGL